MVAHPSTLESPARSEPPGQLLSVDLWRRILADAARNWLADKVPTLGSSLAYYALFSLAPLFLISVAILGMILGAEQARTGALTQMRDLVGEETTRALESIVSNAGRTGGTTATLFGVGMLLFGASGVFVELQGAMNRIWKVDDRVTSGLWAFLRERAFSLAAVLGVGVVLLVSLVLSSTLSVLAGLFPGEAFVGGVLAWQTLNVAVSLGLITGLFALLYRLVPDTEVAWSDTWAGAFVAAVLFSVGKQLFGLYLGQVGIRSLYGSAASVVIILVWVYFSSMILLFGAEVAYSYASIAGSRRAETSASR